MHYVALPVEDIVYSVLFSVVLVFNIAGNSLVIYIIINERGMKTSTNYLLLNLAVADLLVGVFLAPQFIFLPFFRDSVPDGVLGDWLCKLLLYSRITWMASKASIFTMVCLLVERYFAVCRPHSFRQRFSPKIVKILIIISWIYSFLVTLPSFISSHRNNSYYGQNCSVRALYYKVYSSYLVVEAVLSLTTMIFALVKICLSLWCKQTVEPTGEREITERKKKKKVTLCVLAVVVTFLVCWIPNYIRYALKMSLPGSPSTKYVVTMLTTLLMLTNSALDPYLYSFQSSKFKMVMRRIVCCRKENSSDMEHDWHVTGLLVFIEAVRYLSELKHQPDFMPTLSITGPPTPILGLIS